MKIFVLVRAYSCESWKPIPSHGLEKKGDLFEWVLEYFVKLKKNWKSKAQENAAMNKWNEEFILQGPQPLPLLLLSCAHSVCVCVWVCVICCFSFSAQLLLCLNFISWNTHCLHRTLPNSQENGPWQQLQAILLTAMHQIQTHMHTCTQLCVQHYTHTRTYNLSSFHPVLSQSIQV